MLRDIRELRALLAARAPRPSRFRGGAFDLAWALSVVLSRSFALPPREVGEGTVEILHVIPPGIDFCNHGEDSGAFRVAFGHVYCPQTALHGVSRSAGQKAPQTRSR